MVRGRRTHENLFSGLGLKVKKEEGDGTDVKQEVKQVEKKANASKNKRVIFIGITNNFRIIRNNNIRIIIMRI